MAQDRADVVARKQIRYLETGHDDIVAMVHNEMISEGRFQASTKLAGETLPTVCQVEINVCQTLHYIDGLDF